MRDDDDDKGFDAETAGPNGCGLDKPVGKVFGEIVEKSGRLASAC